MQAGTLRVIVSGLPELATTRETLSSVSLTMSFLASHTQAPLNAELPEVKLMLAPTVSGFRRLRTREVRARGAGSITYRRVLSDCFGDEREACCMLGAPTCSNTVDFTLSRSDTLFPDVRIEWKAQASASVFSCPELPAEPQVEIEVVK
ncbi:MAG: hypothetical protein MJD61_10105 [Proteobacteria bacterium]|nr:hypothetical protein [Pseudomonadota bacterium]